MNITLRHLHQHNALLSCYWSVLESLGKTEPDDEPLSVAAYHYYCGLRKTAIFLGWVGNAHKAAIWRYAIWCVEQAQARRLISDPLFAEIFDAAKRMAQGEIGRKSMAKLVFTAAPRCAATASCPVIDMLWQFLQRVLSRSVFAFTRVSPLCWQQ